MQAKRVEGAKTPAVQDNLYYSKKSDLQARRRFAADPARVTRYMAPLAAVHSADSNAVRGLCELSPALLPLHAPRLHRLIEPLQRNFATVDELELFTRDRLTDAFGNEDAAVLSGAFQSLGDDH